MRNLRKRKWRFKKPTLEGLQIAEEKERNRETKFFFILFKNKNESASRRHLLYEKAKVTCGGSFRIHHGLGHPIRVVVGVVDLTSYKQR